VLKTLKNREEEMKLFFKLEILQIGEMFWVLDSSEDLEAMSQVSALVINVAMEEPVYRIELYENDTNLLKDLFLCIVRSMFGGFERKHIPNIFDAVS